VGDELAQALVYVGGVLFGAVGARLGDLEFRGEQLDLSARGAGSDDGDERQHEHAEEQTQTQDYEKKFHVLPGAEHSRKRLSGRVPKRSTCSVGYRCKRK
jgi:hypothetical protein